MELGGFARNESRGCGGSSNDFNNVKTICTGVKDSNVKEVVDAIVEAANMSTSGDGKVFVATVDEVTDISTKEQGEKYL